LHYKRIPLVGLVIATAGCIALAFSSGSLSLVGVDAILALISLGMGTMLPVTTVAVQNAVAPHEMGTTTAAIGFFRQLGGALLVAIFGAIVLAAPGSAPHGGNLTAAADLAARFGWMFGASAVAFALAFLLLLMMEERPLRGRPTAAPEPH
jgi:MFS family permease